jgi:hypothetical protein
MSFFGGGRKSDPQPRPVTQRIAASTPRPVINTAAADVAATKKRAVRGAGAGRRGTQLTGPRGIELEARTRFKTLLGS